MNSNSYLFDIEVQFNNAISFEEASESFKRSIFKDYNISYVRIINASNSILRLEICASKSNYLAVVENMSFAKSIKVLSQR
jgi:hypothetical protein